MTAERASAQAQLYDRVWSRTRVWSHTAWPSWDAIQPCLRPGGTYLEIGAGTRPHLPVQGSCFVDVSLVAASALAAHGARANLGSAARLPFGAATFHLVVACEVLEHVTDDQTALAEIARVLRPDGVFIFSVPLHAHLWTRHDDLVGHQRRYEPTQLVRFLAAQGLRVERYQPGVATQYQLIKVIGARLFERLPSLAVWLEDRVALPLGLWLRRRIPHATAWKRDLASEQDTSTPSALILCRQAGAA